MDVTYEIFKEQPEGPIWVEAVAGLQNINQRLVFLNETSPGEYFAYDSPEARVVAQISSAPEPDSSGNNAKRKAIERTITVVVTRKQMGDSYDLFKQNDVGEPDFVETVVCLKDLEKRLMEFSSFKPGTYLVYDPTSAKFIEPFKNRLRNPIIPIFVRLKAAPLRGRHANT